MANKPSSRTHRMKPLEGLNLTPMIDMVTNLMFFLMMFASIIPVTVIDAPLPKIASTAEEVKKAKDQDNKLELIVYINGKGLRLKSDVGEKSFPVGADGKFQIEEFHKELVAIHERRKDSKEITLIPSDDVKYDTMISVMDAARELKNGDNGFQPVPPEIASKPESAQFNRLFPDVSIGGV